MWYNRFLDLFKTNKTQGSIKASLTTILKQKPRNLYINIYIEDQILFQVLPAKTFIELGFQTDTPDRFVALHFFNKNKTLTLDVLSKFQHPDLGKDYYYFEEPKGNYNYIKEIGVSPKELQNQIHFAITQIYEVVNMKDISIEYMDY